MPHPFDIVDHLVSRALDVPRLRVVDVGAMNIGQQERWNAMIERDQASLVGFEPNADECAKLDAEAGANRRYLPVALGDGAEHTFYVGRAPMTSSLLPPDPEIMRPFNNLWELSEPVATPTLKTARLDDIDEAHPVDFMKLDVQGAEVMVLENARRALATAVAIHTEALFIPLYKGQPLFAEIDQLLRSGGFLFHSFAGIGQRAFRPLIKGANINRGFTQLLWTDAVYFRDFRSFAGLAADRLVALAVVAHEFYGAYDLAAQALFHFDRQAASDHANAYVARLVATDPSITAAAEG